MLSRKAIIIVITVIFSAGVTPIAIRFTQAEGMPSLVIVFLRLWLVTFAMTPLVLTRYHESLMRLTLRDYWLGAIAGFWLTINLFMLFLSLEYASVLVTSVLRRTTPLWIIVPEIIWLGAVFTRGIWLSLALTLVGVALIALGGLDSGSAGSHPLLGAGMSAFGAICFGIYLLIGRQLNNKMPTLLFSWLVFLGGAIVTTFFMVLTRTPTFGYPPSSYVWMLIVTFLAQVLGHIVINMGLQLFSATAMSIIMQMGVVLSAIIAVFAFGEIPTLPQLIGSLLVIIGVVLVTMEQSKQPRSPALAS